MLFVSRRKDRLGGRLNPILNGVRLAKKHGGSFRFFWPDNFLEMEKPSLFFNSDFLDESELEKAIDAKEIHANVKTKGPGVFEFHYRGQRLRKQNKLAKPFGIYLQHSENAKTVCNELSDILVSRLLRDDLRDSAGQVQSNLPKDFIAIHLRRGDLGHFLRAKGNGFENFDRFSPLQSVDVALSNGSTPVIFTDEPEFIPSNLKPHLVENFIDLKPLKNFTSVQRDFVQLFALAKASKIVSAKSAFSSSVAYISGTIPIHPMEYLGTEAFFNAYDDKREAGLNFSDDQKRAAMVRAVQACEMNMGLNAYRKNVWALAEEKYPGILRTTFRKPISHVKNFLYQMTS